MAIQIRAPRRRLVFFNFVGSLNGWCCFSLCSEDIDEAVINFVTEVPSQQTGYMLMEVKLGWC